MSPKAAQNATLAIKDDITITSLIALEEQELQASLPLLLMLLFLLCVYPRTTSQTKHLTRLSASPYPTRVCVCVQTFELQLHIRERRSSHFTRSIP